MNTCKQNVGINALNKTFSYVISFELLQNFCYISNYIWDDTINGCHRKLWHAMRKRNATVIHVHRTPRVENIEIENDQFSITNFKDLENVVTLVLL